MNNLQFSEHFRCQGVITVKKSASINPNAPIGPFAGYGATSRGTRGGRATTSRGGTISSTGIMPCNRPLALTVYFEKDGLIMCERCHTNATCERCAYCEEIIEDVSNKICLYWANDNS